MIAEALLRAKAQKKAILEQSRPIWGAALRALEHYHDVELTYTSNAIEGLVAIHPFSDGNGQRARLRMNLVLSRGGYPPMAIRSADRKACFEAIEHADFSGGKGPCRQLTAQRLDETLAEHIAACRQAGAT